MERDDVRPGPLASDKTSDDSAPGRPEPNAEEVESARLLANESRGALRAEGLDDEAIRRLADAYVALDLGEDTHDFVAWARGASGLTGMGGGRVREGLATKAPGSSRAPTRRSRSSATREAAREEPDAHSSLK